MVICRSPEIPVFKFSFPVSDNNQLRVDTKKCLNLTASYSAKGCVCVGGLSLSNGSLSSFSNSRFLLTLFWGSEDPVFVSG